MKAYEEITKGLNQFDYNMLRLSIGMGRPGMYIEYALQHNALVKGKIREPEFRKDFMKVLRKGLLVISNEKYLKDEFRSRPYKVTDKGWEALCDIEIFKGGDYTFYKEFDGDVNQRAKYEGQIGKIQVGGGNRTNSDVMKVALKNMSPAKRKKFLDSNPRFQNVG